MMQDALPRWASRRATSRTGPGDALPVRPDNCPYREAVAENPRVVCTLHRGITQGLLDRLDPASRVTAFVARDPFTAGCLIELAAD